MQSLVDTLLGAIGGSVILLAVAVLRFTSQDKKVWVDRRQLQHDISQDLLEDLREEREEAEDRAEKAEERAEEAEEEAAALEKRIDDLETHATVMEQKWQWAAEKIEESSIDADPSDAPRNAEDGHV